MSLYMGETRIPTSYYTQLTARAIGIFGEEKLGWHAASPISTVTLLIEHAPSHTNPGPRSRRNHPGNGCHRRNAYDRVRCNACPGVGTDGCRFGTHGYRFRTDGCRRRHAGGRVGHCRLRRTATVYRVRSGVGIGGNSVVGNARIRHHADITASCRGANTFHGCALPEADAGQQTDQHSANKYLLHTFTSIWLFVRFLRNAGQRRDATNENGIQTDTQIVRCNIHAMSLCPWKHCGCPIRGLRAAGNFYPL